MKNLLIFTSRQCSLKNDFNLCEKFYKTHIYDLRNKISIRIQILPKNR